MPTRHERRSATRLSIASPAAFTAADVAVGGFARSQRQLVQWSLLLCPDRKKGSAT